MKVTFKQLDVAALRESIVDTLEASLAGLIEGSADDIRMFAVDISRDLALAVADNRKDLVEILVDQLGLLAEINRIRLANQSNDAIKKIIQTIATFALNLVVAAV